MKISGHSTRSNRAIRTQAQKTGHGLQGYVFKELRLALSPTHRHIDIRLSEHMDEALR